MKACLLDVNVLLALAWPNHVHHADAQRWFDAQRRHGWATCAVTELGFVRLSAHPRFSTHPQTPDNARALLKELVKLPEHHYWQEGRTGLHGPAFDAVFSNVLTHELVTDAYLVGVALHNGGQLATLDRPLARVFGNAVVLIGAPA